MMYGCAGGVKDTDGNEVDITDEMIQEILNSLTITKLSNYTMTIGSGWTGASNGTYSKATNAQRARTLEVIELDPTKTYKVSLAGIDSNYWYGVQGIKTTDSSTYDSGWVASATETTVTGLESIVLNFAYGSGRTTTMTMEHIAEIAKYLTITEVTE